MRRRKNSLLEGVWAPLADIMTLVACVFLIVFIASMVAYKDAESKRAEAVKNSKAAIESQLKTAEKLKGALAKLRNTNVERKKMLTEILSPNSNNPNAEYIASSGIEVDINGAIKLPEHALFGTGRAVLTRAGNKLVNTIVADIVARLLADPTIRILIAGHTDSIPIRTKKFPSNWELSTGRATNVLRAILAAKPDIPIHRIFAAGFADTQLIPGIESSDGRNRRVEIHVLTDGEKLLKELEESQE